MLEISIRFSEAFDNMPPVPRPLPENYYFITESALLNEAKQVAPYKETGLTTDFSEALPLRRLQRLKTWYNKVLIHRSCFWTNGDCFQALEFRVVHRSSAMQNRSRLIALQMASLLLSTAITVILLVSNTETTARVAGGLAATVAGLTSWVKYSKYEYLAGKSEHSHC